MPKYSSPLVLLPFNPASGQLDQREWITTTRLKEVVVDIQMTSKGISDNPEQSGMALLALPSQPT